MSFSKDILETEVRITSNKAMAELKKLETETSGLRKEQGLLKKQKEALILLGKKETKEYREVSKAMRENGKEIRSNEERQRALRATIGITSLTMKELRLRANELKKALNNTSKSANPKGYAKLEKELGQVETQMTRLKGKTSLTGKIMKTFGAILPIAGVGLLLTKLGQLIP